VDVIIDPKPLGPAGLDLPSGCPLTPLYCGDSATDPPARGHNGRPVLGTPLSALPGVLAIRYTGTRIGSRAKERGSGCSSTPSA
jgi:hypothetical protein